MQFANLKINVAALFIIALSACAAPAPSNQIQSTHSIRAAAESDQTVTIEVKSTMTASPIPTRTPVPARQSAPEIKSEAWLNSPPLTAQDLRGKVVMVEFWTSGCINCRNVIPELKKMYADFAPRGFTIIGVHSPEFDYEKNINTVRQAIKDFDIRYPVALDNDFANWNRYRNRYWPAIYLLDKQGALRYTHIGEGAYNETRNWITTLLAE